MTTTNHSRRWLLKTATFMTAAATLPSLARADDSAIAPAAPAEADPIAPPPVTSLSIMLDWYVNPTHGPIVIAHQKGFFKEHGLDVTLRTPADPSAPPKLVAAGQIDLALSYQPQLHLQVGQGLPLVRVGTLIGTPLNVLVVRKDSNIKSLSDLKGKSVGYSVGGVERVLLDGMLKHSGLSEHDIDLVNVNFSLTPALISGKVDAVTGAFRNFELAQMAQEGVEGRPFYIEEHGVPAYEELVFIANTETIASHQRAFSSFMKAIEEAALWTINHPNEGWELFKAYDPVLDNELNHQAWQQSVSRFALRPAATDAGRYLRFQQFLLDNHAIEQKVPVDRLTLDINNLPPAPK
ncbi:ABC transporter substrate-binding protein [Larsenimonas rhizosphaerae]|uniref:ABC transporter substrate-binding protein n=1 Tax=Larsenimonas rhizosphaerae TaxID=2944682 RepID=A0AA41ZMC5_9GAMM|nr:ABC transporter substrate-binding protein [Larsenimonas rhizosphaerae]MCM2130811.1 ABC transporter substrate-binding protein [Larsenimonas rhizosphaerae]MCX2523515.1 ABC transporter substrate-binding protein [Larsenimonas rhizosphaerae]